MDIILTAVRLLTHLLRKVMTVIPKKSTVSPVIVARGLPSNLVIPSDQRLAKNDAHDDCAGSVAIAGNRHGARHGARLSASAVVATGGVHVGGRARGGGGRLLLGRRGARLSQVQAARRRHQVKWRASTRRGTRTNCWG